MYTIKCPGEMNPPKHIRLVLYLVLAMFSLGSDQWVTATATEPMKRTSELSASLQAGVMVWTNVLGGSWSSPTKWNPNGVPGEGDTVYITNSGTYSVTFNTTATVAGLVVGVDSGVQTLSLNGGRLVLTGTARFDHASLCRMDGGAIEGGEITTTNGSALVVLGSANNRLDGVVLNGDLDLTTINYAQVVITNGLELNGTAWVGGGMAPRYGALWFTGSQSLAGNGTVVMGGGYEADDNVVGLSYSGTTLTLGPGIKVRGELGMIGAVTALHPTNPWHGPADVSLINQGTISADVNGGTIVLGGANLLNQSLMRAVSGGQLVMNGITVNEGWLSLGIASSTLSLTGDFTQTTSGTLHVPIQGVAPGTGHAQLNISGTATLAGALNVTLENAFVPASSTAFTVVTYGAWSGAFATYPGAGTLFDPDYQATGLDLIYDGPQSPLILVQPADLTVTAGEEARLSVTAVGEAPLGYQWFRGDVPVPGANAREMVLPAASVSDAGFYSVTVSNAFGMASSDLVEITVESCSPLPVDLAAWWPVDGTPVNLVGGDAIQLVNGATYSSSLVGQGIHLDGVDDYLILPQSPITNDAFTLEAWIRPETIIAAPVVFEQGTSLFNRVGLQITSEGALGGFINSGHYQAQSSNGVIRAGQWSHIAFAQAPGAQQIYLYVNGALVADGSTFGEQVNNQGPLHLGISGFLQSNVLQGVMDEVAIHNRVMSLEEVRALFLAGSAGRCGGYSVPLIVESPASLSVAAGSIAQFSVQAVGLPQPSYQWRRNGMPLPGANGGTLMLSSAWLSDQGSYSVVVSNGMGKVTSTAATLTVNTPPAITRHPQSKHVVTGATATLSAGAQGSVPLVLRWRKNGTVLAGATATNLVLANVQVGDSGMYDVVASNAFGMATSMEALLTVVDPPGVVSPPIGSDPVGGTVTLCVTASGSDPLRYQWRRNGANLPGATNECYVVDVSTPEGSGSYSVVVANNAGTVVAGPVDVTQSLKTLTASDAFSGPSLDNEPSRIRSSNAGATKELGEPDHAGKPGGASVWFKRTAPGDGVATIDTRGSSFDTLLAVYTGTSVDALQWVAEDEDSGGFFTSDAQFNVQSGVEYHIAVDGLAGATGTFYIHWSFDGAEPPVPLILEQPESLTLMMGDMALFDVTADTNSGPVFYQWYFNDGELADATNDTFMMAAVSVSDVGSYSVVITNTQGGMTRSLTASLEIGLFSDLISQDKAPDLFLPGNGVGPLHVTGVPGGVVSVALGGAGYHIFDNIGSTTSEEDAQVGALIGGSSQYVGRFRPEVGATMVMDTVGSTFDTTMALFTVAGNVITGVVATDDDGAGDGMSSRIQWEAQAQQDYVVAVDRAGEEEGIVQLNWKMGRLPPVVHEAEELTLPLGGLITFHAEVMETFPAPTFQWRRDGVDLPGATGSHYTLSDVFGADAGGYTVVVSNLMGVVTQEVSVVSVDASQAVATRSEFETDAEGWLIMDGMSGMAPQHVPGNGMQSGHVMYSDGANPGTWFWAAPGEYAGNLGFAYGGWLTFEMFKSATEAEVPGPGVLLMGGGQMLAYGVRHVRVGPGTGLRFFRLRKQ